MTIYVAEIEGRAIIAFAAGTREEAEAFRDEPWLQEDLMVLQSEGRFLWDGESEIFIREATEDERSRCDTAHAKTILAGDDDIPDDDDWYIWLVPDITDVTDEMDDEDT